MAEMVYVRYIGGKYNKIGFVTQYKRKIAEILVARGHVEIITDPVSQQRASEDLAARKDSAKVPAKNAAKIDDAK
jgi:hypothetical protein